MAAAALLLDSLIAVLAAVIAWILITGGGIFVVGTQRISVMGVDNPLLGLVVLCLIRYAALYRIPWFGLPRWPFARIDGAARTFLTRLHARIAELTTAQAARIAAGVAAATLIVKAILALTNPGFFSGDDVEIHEMTLRVLWRTDWTVWDLRNAFFPLGVVYPAQKLFVLVGGDLSASVLVFAGRLSVVLLSSMTVWLVWLAGRRLWPDAPGWAAVAAVLFAGSKLHIAFGSSELPRPVATVFVTGAFVLLLAPRIRNVIAAAVCLGVAACFRFSEAVFLGPAVLALLLQRRPGPAFVLVAIAATTAAAIVGVTDAWYWGEPFHSVRAAVDYTLVQRLSSRGYQSVFWYVTHLLEWINPALAVLAVIAVIAAPRVTDLWAWLPILVLSALPHKEARYAIPVVPFVCLIATRGLLIAVTRLQQTGAPARRWHPIALLSLLVVGFVQDAGHWRLPRTNADVRFAHLAHARLPAGTPVSVEQAWRLGGRLHLHPRGVIDLDPGRLGDPAYIWQRTPAGAWIILDRNTSARANLGEPLRARGYEREPAVVEGSRYELWRPGGAGGR
jgi:hypothetical protein